MTSGPGTAPPQERTSGLRRRVNRWLSPDHAVGQSLMLLRMRAQLAAWRPASDEERALKRMISQLAPAYTMVALPRLQHLAAMAAQVAKEKIPGAIVECGTWRGGGLALMDWVLRQHGTERRLFGFDSFEGLPPPTSRDGAVTRAFFEGWCAASEEDVYRALAVAGTDRQRVTLVRGWLSATVARTDTGPIALLNLDVDWYDSVTVALDALFDRVVEGGFINFDDYGRWPGCDAAVHDFFARRRLPLEHLRRTGAHGASFRK